MVYARDTNVSVNRTREEIIATLERYGADAFGYAQDGNQQVVFFRMGGPPSTVDGGDAQGGRI